MLCIIIPHFNWRYSVTRFSWHARYTMFWQCVFVPPSSNRWFQKISIPCTGGINIFTPSPTLFLQKFQNPLSPYALSISSSFNPPTFPNFRFFSSFGISCEFSSEFRVKQPSLPLQFQDVDCGYFLESPTYNGHCEPAPTDCHCLVELSSPKELKCYMEWLD